MKNGDETEKF